MNRGSGFKMKQVLVERQFYNRKFNNFFNLFFSHRPSSSSNIDRFNAFFLKVQLGWFFEGNRFPRELFIQNIVNRGKKTASHAGLGIDSRNCVKRSLLYTCCPYVSELKVILSQFLTGFKATRCVMGLIRFMDNDKTVL